ncbi:MAG TPA: DUF1385 domain-containing protein [Dehalococcoidia bacterium]|nr:DUF1385 domain-containing protein [Dehalococcoidia bacterium]
MSADENSKLYYGGQAVIEGVMIRGRRSMVVSVRKPNGEIADYHEELRGLFSGNLREFAFVRGVLVLIETLALGMRALNFSSNVQLGADESEASKTGPALWISMAIALVFGIAIFFLGPVFATNWLHSQIANEYLVVSIEGLLRVLVFIGYIWAIGFLPDIRRVFAYHGAEHKTIHAYEADEPLTVESIQRFSPAHPRCGTSFLLVVALVSVIVFVSLGKLDLPQLLLSRIVFVPVIAAIAYEVIRFGGSFQHIPLVAFLFKPNLGLQWFTTRQPDDGMVEVAIHALQRVIAAEKALERRGKLDDEGVVAIS